MLVAEAEDESRELVTFWLRRSGYDVIAVADGEEALYAATTLHPDAALLDLMMPGLDGLEVARRLRCEEATARLPIILLTADAHEVDVPGGFETGVDDCIRKPFSPRELIARLQVVIGRR